MLTDERKAVLCLYCMSASVSVSCQFANLVHVVPNAAVVIHTVLIALVSLKEQGYELIDSRFLL